MCLLPGILTSLLICAPTSHAEVATPAESHPTVTRISIENQAITPVVARFVGRAIDEAEGNGSVCLIIELDTPGGLLESTQQIVTRILRSRIPVVVYVSPSGGHAASAGLFITLASHVAAMAPGTRLGAAHPVQFGGLPIGPQPAPGSNQQSSGDEEEHAPRKPGSPAEEKLVNDTQAWARGLAELRGRNGQWAALAVSESRVLLASEAVRENVVDLEAADLPELLQKLDGREVAVGRTTIRLRTKGAQVHTLQMWWGERFLGVISNPNVVMLLLMFGVYGLLFELYTPGWRIAGTLGAVSLVLALFGLSLLPINYAALALIVLGLGMFVAEVKVTSYGALTVGGIVCLILGGMMLVDSPTGFMRVSLGVLIPLAVSTGLIVVFLLGRVVQVHRGRVLTGGEALVRQTAVAREKFTHSPDGYHGQVLVHGERWRARSRLPVADHQAVTITARDGLTLEVEAEQNPRSDDNAAHG
jgi:membrane-bound serine protease (ClpP class)